MHLNATFMLNFYSTTHVKIKHNINFILFNVLKIRK